MLHDPSEVEQGRIVFLYPHTRTASRECHAQLAVTVIKPPAQHWPYLIVAWKDAAGQDQWQRVHRDNVRLRRPASVSTKEEKTQGDSVGGGKTPTVKRVRVPPKRREIALDPDEEQLPLW